MPEGAVYVGRPTKWGNPYVAGGKSKNPFAPVPDNAAMAVSWFHLAALRMPRSTFEPLRGKDLACWCKLDQPCHADVLLELANA